MGLQDLLANLERTVRLANLVRAVSGDLLDLREPVDSPGLLVCLASKGTEDTQVSTVPRGRVEPLVPRVSLVPLVRTELQDQWDPVGCPVREDVPDPLDLLVLVEMMVCPALLVLLARLVPLVLQASLALLVQRERLVLPAPEGPKVHKAPVESLVPPDHPDPLVPLATQELMESPDLKDQLVLLVSLVLLASLGHVVLPGPKVLPDLSARKEHLETLVWQVSRERLDPKESLDQLAPREPLVLLERRGREDPEGSPARLDPLDLQEREELLVTVVSQDRMVWPVPREPLVSAVPVESVDPRELTEILVALESLVYLVPEVLLVALVMLVPKAKLDLVELPERMGDPDPRDQWEPEDSPVSWDSLGLREPLVSLAKEGRKVCSELLVLEVCLGKTERPALQDHQDPRVLLEREESRDSLVPLVSRVFPGLLVPLVRVANPETWVFLEREVLLVLLDPGVSVVSQEREEVLGLRVCKVPAVCLELLELTDPREPLVQVVHPEPRALQVCRACQEREEPLASQDPRVTEVTTVRKDLRVLPAKMVREVLLVQLVPLALLVPMERRESLVPLDPLERLVLVVLLVTGVRLDLQDLLVLLDPLVQTVSLG